MCPHLRSKFRPLVSYNRLLRGFPRALLSLVVYYHSCMVRCSGRALDASTKLAVWHIATSTCITARGKSLVDWFWGIKRQLVFNNDAALLMFKLTQRHKQMRKARTPTARPGVVTKTGNCGDDYRPLEKHFPDRAYTIAHLSTSWSVSYMV